ncbi:NADP(H)-dependent aldo-keto reductase [Kordiimonas sp. SCSIO 12610]|uniref:NADP(H)-dependent aldo-keto reductase n=1 Tax=Kordiimonas sp. SCSIO 12610 TaxID=2829597 RepID=UPI002109E84E|nr:NADP(H)-dependent aldo-keto reductase [Kordiimonas sp. SCSIO 12610]UTW56713.1 NADP(H)-dependent aldo-keto reductase [Kordiimonas sp. SCSIO 12610]
MEYRRLGRTDMSVSKICLGTMTFGQQNTEAEGHDQMDMAVDHGVNFFDTAEMYSVPARAETYGRTEEIIGTWFQKTGKRKDIILASKVAGPGPSFDYMRPHLHKNGPRLDRQSVLEACNASLKRLQTDYIDLYQIHWPERRTNFFGYLRYKHSENDTSIQLEETLSAMQELVKAGKIRAVGLSNETSWGMMHAISLSEKLGLPRVASVQNPYNLLNRSYEIGMAEASIREECGLLAYSPLASGALTGKYIGGAKPAGARMTLFGDQYPRYFNEQGKLATVAYVDLAKKHGLDPSQMANTFVNLQPFLTSNIIGATNLDQLKTALDTADMTLSEDVLKDIEAIETLYPMPCP